MIPRANRSGSEPTSACCQAAPSQLNWISSTAVDPLLSAVDHIALYLEGRGLLIVILGEVAVEDVEPFDGLGVGDGCVGVVDGILDLTAQGRLGGQLLDGPGLGDVAVEFPPLERIEIKG